MGTGACAGLSRGGVHPRAKGAGFLEAEDITSGGKGSRDLKTGNARGSGSLRGRVEGWLGLDMARERGAFCPLSEGRAELLLDYGRVESVPRRWGAALF